ncbi:hypothetical protein [Niveibacterium sp. COAC-50]|uniref:hypothetical protein n=1 Tax=Niveibacterium sp. COAC-50 TaxID=2729384 RepID=UPI0015579B9B|nr:hypothetical protein [Niveibacterium sp. COAC-50]
MAFDMYAGDRHEAIYDQDEYIFAYVAEAPGAFPQLEALYSRFYSEFSLTPEHAGLLVHELLALHDRFGANSGKAQAGLVLRLAQFFSAAARNSICVRCSGD